MGLFDAYSTLGSSGDISELWSAAQTVGADQSFVTPRGPDTVPSNALQSMQPISFGDGSTGSGFGANWGDFLQKSLGSVLGYSLQKDAVQSGVRPGVGTQYMGQVQAGSVGGLLSNPLVLGVIVIGVVLAVRR